MHDQTARYNRPSLSFATEPTITSKTRGTIFWPSDHRVHRHRATSISFPRFSIFLPNFFPLRWNFPTNPTFSNFPERSQNKTSFPRFESTRQFRDRVPRVRRYDTDAWKDKRAETLSEAGEHRANSQVNFDEGLARLRANICALRNFYIK